MSISLLFWVLMLFWLIFGLVPTWPITNYRPLAGNVILFILIGILGWKVFGPALHG